VSGGELSSGDYANKHPLDWYVEQGWEWEQVVDEIGLEDEILGNCAIWDPACGYGHSLSRLQGIGFAGALIASDLVDNLTRSDFDRLDRLSFSSLDFLEPAPLRSPFALSIWMNPPYSYRPGLLEAFCRQALAVATHRVVVLAPLKWMSGGKFRSPFFRREFPPKKTMHFTTRPSMPPGDRIHLMGGKAYKNGKVDYVAVEWDVRNPTAPGETREVWLPLLGERS
jgi:hypothetical protein